MVAARVLYSLIIYSVPKSYWILWAIEFELKTLSKPKTSNTNQLFHNLTVKVSHNHQKGQMKVGKWTSFHTRWEFRECHEIESKFHEVLGRWDLCGWHAWEKIYKGSKTGIGAWRQDESGWVCRKLGEHFSWSDSVTESREVAMCAAVQRILGRTGLACVKGWGQS